MLPLLVDRAVLDELGAVIGPEKLGRLLDRFAASLATAFEDAAQADVERGREAHTLISMSGMLGCAAFSDACRGLEQAVQAGADLAGPLRDIRSLRDLTVAALHTVRTGGARAA